MNVCPDLNERRASCERQISTLTFLVSPTCHAQLCEVIPLDPEEILGAGCADAIKRALLGCGTLAAGGVAAVIGFFSFVVIEAAVAFFLTGIVPPISPTDSATLFLIPILGFASIGATFSVPNTIFAFIYYSKTDEPKFERFLIHSGIHQIATFITLAAWFGGYDYFDWMSMELTEAILAAVSLLLQIATFVGLYFIGVFFRNRMRILHEEHLMTVSALNAARKQEIANKVHVPPPPGGVVPPKVRPLTQKEDEK